MYFFIAIIFIAELIIFVTVIQYIRKADKFVCQLNARVINSRENIKETFINIRADIHKVELSIKFLINYVKVKREEYILKILKQVLTYGLIILLEAQISKSKKLKKVSGIGKSLLQRLLT